MADTFDRILGALHGVPDVVSTRETTLRVVVPMIGAAQTFILQTFRQREIGDTIFLEVVSNETTTRLAIPPAVADAIARQRDALTDKSRSKAAKIKADDRMKRGELPGFMRTGKRGKRGKAAQP